MPEKTPIEQLRENMTGPHQVAVDGTQTTQHSLRDQIEAARFLAAEETKQSRGLGVRVHRIRTPGGGGV